jgi:hypothetical protein
MVSLCTHLKGVTGQVGHWEVNSTEELVERAVKMSRSVIGAAGARDEE